MGKFMYKDQPYGGTTNYASAINCVDKDGNESTVQAEMDKFNDKVDEQNKNLGGFTPIIDETGKITGYKTNVGGADTVFPFSRQVYVYTNEHSGETSTNAGVFNLKRYKLNNDLSLTLVGEQASYVMEQIEGALYLAYSYPTLSLMLKKGYTCLFAGVVYTATDADVAIKSENFSSGRGNNSIATIIAFE